MMNVDISHTSQAGMFQSYCGSCQRTIGRSASEALLVVVDKAHRSFHASLQVFNRRKSDVLQRKTEELETRIGQICANEGAGQCNDAELRAVKASLRRHRNELAWELTRKRSPERRG